MVSLDLMFPVSRSKENALLERFRRLGIREADIEESFVTSGGPGGQHVNRSSTCVLLRHRPTGMVVRCQQERSQALNRFLARRILADRIEAEVLGRQTEERRRVEKIRRQKRKRSKRAKEKMLAGKHMRSERKALRSPVRADDWN